MPVRPRTGSTGRCLPVRRAYVRRVRLEIGERGAIALRIYRSRGGQPPNQFFAGARRSGSCLARPTCRGPGRSLSPHRHLRQPPAVEQRPRGGRGAQPGVQRAHRAVQRLAVVVAVDQLGVAHRLKGRHLHHLGPHLQQGADRHLAAHRVAVAEQHGLSHPQFRSVADGQPVAPSAIGQPFGARDRRGGDRRPRRDPRHGRLPPERRQRAAGGPLLHPQQPVLRSIEGCIGSIALLGRGIGQIAPVAVREAQQAAQGHAIGAVGAAPALIPPCGRGVAEQQRQHGLIPACQHLADVLGSAGDGAEVDGRAAGVDHLGLEVRSQASLAGQYRVVAAHLELRVRPVLVELRRLQLHDPTHQRRPLRPSPAQRQIHPAAQPKLGAEQGGLVARALGAVGENLGGEHTAPLLEPFEVRGNGLEQGVGVAAEQRQIEGQPCRALAHHPLVH